jgi:hypothetical protein
MERTRNWFIDCLATAECPQPLLAQDADGVVAGLDYVKSTLLVPPGEAIVSHTRNKPIANETVLIPKTLAATSTTRRFNSPLCNAH